MIAVDTNILAYAHRRDHEWQDSAAACNAELTQDGGRRSILRPSVHKFFSVDTLPGDFDLPSTCVQAHAQVDAWFATPTL